MARFLFVNQYYWPDFASTGQHLTDLCEHLAAHGHEVRVLCSRGRYLEGRGEAPLHEERAGVEIFRVPATSFGKKNHVGRMVDYLSFHALAALHLVKARWADVVVTLTTPPLIGWVGRLAARVGRAQHVNFVMDLHPDAEFESGMIRRRSLFGRLVEAVAGNALRRADKNVVLGLYQGKRVLERGVEPERVVEIPVWSDGNEIRPVPLAENPLRRELGWSDRFVVMYSGNAGIVHGFDELLDAATELAVTDPTVHFAFVGGGPRTGELKDAVAERGLTNVSFRGYFDREDLGWSLTAPDVHFMSLLPEHVGVAVPGKLYGILAAGRPVLFAGSARSETAETILVAGAGAVFEPGRGAALAAEIRALKADPERVEAMGRAGRAHFEEHHDRSVCVEVWRELLESMTDLPDLRAVPAPEAGADVDSVPAPLPARTSERESTAA